MSLKPYPDYKESRQQWLGKVPSHWEVRPSKSVFGLRNEPEIAGDVHLTPSQSLGVLPQAEYIKVTGNRVVLALAGTTMKHIEVNDFVIHLRSFQGGIEWSRFQGKVSSAYTVLRPKANVVPAFFRHCLKSRGYIETIASLTDQLRDGQSMRYYDFGKTPLPLPPVSEQQTIADFLDRETTEIDAFISDQEELIVLLAERRTATISAKTFPYSSENSHPSVPLVRIGQAFSESDARVESASPEDLLSVSIHSGVSPWKELHDKEPRSETLSNYKVVKPGDIVLNRMRAFQGGLGEARTPGVVSPDYMVMHIRESADSTYLAYLMKSQQFVAEMSSRLRGIGSEEHGTVRTPRINPRDLSNIRVPLPSIEEQRRIAKCLDHEIAEIDAAVAEAREAIVLSKERRAAVISAAVTGKIDVRGASAPTTNKVEAVSVGVA